MSALTARCLPPPPPPRRPRPPPHPPSPPAPLTWKHDGLPVFTCDNEANTGAS